MLLIAYHKLVNNETEHCSKKSQFSPNHELVNNKTEHFQSCYININIKH